MKRKLLDLPWAFAASLILSLGVIGCYAQVYTLEFDWRLVVLWLAAVTFGGCLLLPLRRGSEIVLCLCALALGYLLRLPQTMAEIKSLLTIVSVVLNNTYRWGYFAFPGHTVGAIELPVILYGSGVALSVSRCILRRRGPVIPFLLTVPVMLMCPMVPEAEPGLWPVYGVLVIWAMLLLTYGARKNSAIQGRKLTLTALIPVLVTAFALLLLNPQAGYRDHGTVVRQKLMSRMQVTVPIQTHFTFTPHVSFEENLAALNGGQQQRMPVLTVTAPITGSLYLRGQDFDTYTGKSWTGEESRQENFDGWGDSQGDVEIRTFAVQDLIYLPYYPGTATILTGGALANTGGVVSYRFPMNPNGSALSQEALERYLRLPDSTRDWALGYLNGVTDPEQIGNMVRSSADYDLRTPKMPDGEQDFAKWFLEESDRGFCVHFASAATVLLRAAGIPARYVVGYLQEVEAGRPAIVSTLSAHAWAEYYDLNAGYWKILETTASQTPVTVPETTAPTVSVSTMETTAAVPAGNTEAPTTVGETQRQLHISPLVWLVPAFVLLVILRRELVLLLRREAIKRSDLRRRTLLYWRQAEALSKASGTPIPEPLLELAQRAKFSRHRITAMNLEPLQSFCEECREKLKAGPWWKRMLDRFWFVRY